MNRSLVLVANALFIGATALLNACGGSDGSSSGAAVSSSTSSTTSSTSSASTTASVHASGVLTAFGSVFVNGTEYAVNGTTSIINGDANNAPSDDVALLVGMTVEVTASNNTASVVTYASAVRGEIDAINTAASTITVLGQTVVVSSSTAFAGSSTTGGTTTAVTGLGNLSVGNYVVVYGYLDCTTSTSTTSCASGSTQVLASLVYKPTAAGTYGTSGYAQSVDGTSDTFLINGLTVSYASATCSSSPCSVADGEFVTVAAAAATASTGGALTLTATSLTTSSTAPVLVSGETISIQGPVSDLNTASSTFVLRGVTINGSVLAATVATLANSDIVQVTGTVNATGAIQASAITIENQATFTLTAPVTAISSTADTLVVLGKTFTVNSSTSFYDQASNVRPFNLSNFASVLAVDNQLQVSGYVGSSGIIATQVVRVPTPSTAYVAAQGVVTADSLSADTLAIGGVAVSLTSSTSLNYLDSGSSTSLAAFLDAIVVGSSVVAVQGSAGTTAGTLTATSASLLSSDCGWAGGGF